DVERRLVCRAITSDARPYDFRAHHERAGWPEERKRHLRFDARNQFFMMPDAQSGRGELHDREADVVEDAVDLPPRYEACGITQFGDVVLHIVDHDDGLRSLWCWSTFFRRAWRRLSNRLGFGFSFGLRLGPTESRPHVAFSHRFAEDRFGPINLDERVAEERFQLLDRNARLAVLNQTQQMSAGEQGIDDI